MKTNLPVTQREVDYPESKVFVTKTDTKGIITYANDSFCEIAGFSREELIGKNHNMVRHPDMPPWAFKSLWDTVQGGHPWRGIVKNRAKNGDHYWVRATVAPITEHGQVVGYISLRKKPSRTEVTAAEALYKSGAAPSGKVSLLERFRNLSLTNKLQLLIQPALLLMLGVGSVAIINDNKTNMLEEAQQRARAVSDELINSSNMLMVTGQIGNVETRKLLLKKLSESDKVVGVRLVRGDPVSKQFGAGSPEAQARDDAVRNAESSKQSYSAVEERDGKKVFRVVTPYLFSHDFHGTDCLSCHQAETGSVSGLSDVQIDLTEGYGKLHKVIVEQIILQIIFQLILFFFIRLIVTRFVVKPVDEIKQHLSEVVNGKMTSQVDIAGRDEMGEVLCSVQSAKVLLGSIIDQIASVSGHIDERAKHLIAAMTDVSQGSQTQSDAAGSMAAAVEEMTVSIDQIAENAGEVKRISENSAALAGEGGKIVQQVVSDMTVINQAVMNTAQTIQQLGDQSDQIHNVVKVIKEIADQTNLLALNAAIEAARAGEQGRGFAVVADEVRKLAEKTGGSTQEIAQMIEAIRSSTSNAIAEMVSTVEKVKAGSEMAGKAGSAIVEINEGVTRALGGVEDISSSIHEQSQASRDISVNVEKVASMSDKNSEAVREVFGTVENLESLSGNLRQSVSHFKV